MTPSMIPSPAAAVLPMLLSPAPAKGAAGDAAMAFTLDLPTTGGLPDALAALATPAATTIVARPLPAIQPFALPSGDPTADLFAATDADGRQADADTGTDLPASPDDVPLDPAIAWLTLAPVAATPPPAAPAPTPPVRDRATSDVLAAPKATTTAAPSYVPAQASAAPSLAAVPSPDAPSAPTTPVAQPAAAAPVATAPDPAPSASTIASAVATTSLTPLPDVPPATEPTAAATAPVATPAVPLIPAAATPPSISPQAPAPTATQMPVRTRQTTERTAPPSATVPAPPSQPALTAAPTQPATTARPTVAPATRQASPTLPAAVRSPTATTTPAVPTGQTAPVRLAAVAVPVVVPARFQPTPAPAPVASDAAPDPVTVTTTTTDAPPVTTPQATPLQSASDVVVMAAPRPAAPAALVADRVADPVVEPARPLAAPVRPDAQPAQPAAATRRVETAAPVIAAVQPIAFLRQTAPAPVAAKTATAPTPAADPAVPALTPTTIVQPAPTDAPAVATPAARAFGAAIHAATIQRSEPRLDTPGQRIADASVALPTEEPAAATPVAVDAAPSPLPPSTPAVAEPRPAAAISQIVQAPLDLTQRQWPQNMIARIEGLRDMANAADTSIRLVPDALGRIDISMRSDGDTVHIAFAAEQAATRQLLQDAAPRLHAAAEERGLKLGDTRVAPAGDTATQNGTGSGNGNGAPGSQQGGTASQTMGGPSAGAQQQQGHSQQQQQQREAARAAPNRAPRPSDPTTADSDAADQAGGRIA